MRLDSVPLLTLPVELICHILGFLEIADLVRCTELTKYLRKVIADSSRLQYHIELAKHRMVSILLPSASPPYIARLQTLRDRERAWKTLTWKGRYNLQLPPTGSVYEFVGGFYGNGKEDDRRITASISFLELPDADSARLENGQPDLKMWTHPMQDVTIIDFTMDPSQDLLVLIALATSGSGYVYELHLRSLSTNEPHPKAPLPVLPCLLKPSHTHQASEHIAAVRVQVSGDLVALLVKEVHDSIGAHLEIWDWINDPQQSCKLARISGIDDFTFMSQNTFLIVRPTGNFEVYTFKNPITSSDIPICQASYSFPPLSQGYMYWYITMSSNPAPGSTPRHSSKRTTTEGSGKQLYHPSPSERIHACCLYLFNPTTDDHEERVHCFVFFVNLDTLLNPPAEWLKKSTPPQSPVFQSRTNASQDSASDTEPDSPTFPLTTPSIFSQSAPASSTVPQHPPPPPPPEYLYFPILSPAPTPPSMPFPSPQNMISTHSLNSFAIYPPPAAVRAPSNSLVFAGPQSRKPTHVPWSTWGPQSTRWFKECLNTDWQHSIYGLRTVESVSVDKMKIQAAPRIPPIDLQNENGPSTSSRQRAAGRSITESQSMQTDGADTIGEVVGNGNAEEDDENVPIPQRFLRLRDYNPYAIMQTLEEENDNSKKGKNKMDWGSPRVVVEPSRTNVKGVFKEDITSWLPYVEVVSEQTFEVTDVMMDDCRLLLLRRGTNGRLRRVDVLTM